MLNKHLLSSYFSGGTLNFYGVFTCFWQFLNFSNKMGRWGKNFEDFLEIVMMRRTYCSFMLQIASVKCRAYELKGKTSKQPNMS